MVGNEHSEVKRKVKVLITTTLELLDNKGETIVLEDVESSVEHIGNYEVFNEMTIHFAKLKDIWRLLKSIV
jgi:hypothetical protein